MPSQEEDSNLFQCFSKHCPSKFSLKHDLDIHIIDEHKGKIICPYQGCYKSLRPSIRSSHLKKCHIISKDLRKNLDDQVTCRHCEKSFSDFDFLAHLSKCPKKTTPNRQWLCQNCGKRVSCKNSRNHLERCTSDGQRKYQCDHAGCGATFATMAAMSIHRYKIHRFRERCRYKGCDKLVKLGNRLQHERTVHAKIKETCKNCGKEMLFTSMRSHRQRCMYGSEKLFECTVEGCEVKFAHKWDMSRHVTVTHGAPVKCPYEDCPGMFKRNYLSHHIKAVHQKQKKFCKNCGKEISFHNLNSHLLRCISNGDKKFPCSHLGCKMAFTTLEYANIHMNRVHQEPVNCPFEGCKGVYKPYKLDSHIRRIHEGEAKEGICRYCAKTVEPRVLRIHEVNCSKNESR